MVPAVETLSRASSEYVPSVIRDDGIRNVIADVSVFRFPDTIVESVVSAADAVRKGRRAGEDWGFVEV
ncbi:hypothetical protein SAMN05421671_4542 [Pimelobacter simplex]|nr:hypothetical protein SAMN05421671_4542 [Pimelobacter simplex]